MRPNTEIDTNAVYMTYIIERILEYSDEKVLIDVQYTSKTPNYSQMFLQSRNGWLIKVGLDYGPENQFIFVSLINASDYTFERHFQLFNQIFKPTDEYLYGCSIDISKGYHNVEIQLKLIINTLDRL